MSIQDCANAIRILSIDSVEAAQSGHPGMPLGMADIAAVLWLKFLKHNPKNPSWFNRDRFVLSNGHGSMLLYSLLHLTGYALSINDLKQFRHLHSKTPGHPEYRETPGVETSTGPLAQGLANAVGMAIAEKVLAARFNQVTNTSALLIDHYTYVFVGDGCLMEGLSHEVCSLAGTLNLGKLIVFYDNNGISIDGNVAGWFTDDTVLRFQSYHWHVITIDGHDHEAIEKAIIAAQAEKQKPTLIICDTHIGFASSLQGSEKSHGAPLGKDEIQKVRETLNWPYKAFTIPDFIYEVYDHVEKGIEEENQWIESLEQYKKEQPEQYSLFLRRITGDLPFHWDAISSDLIQNALLEEKPLATRKASQYCINALAPYLPELLGGSADLTSSNNTDWRGMKAISSNDANGNYLYYGVREFGMSAIMNGIALHGGFIPYGGTFLVFSDYARGAIRLSALMRQRVIYILTHDSIGLGEDGPTHQPIEHAAMLRMTPHLDVWRPADIVETAVAWICAIERDNGPSALLLSRQNLEVIALKDYPRQKEDIKKGAYIVYGHDKIPDVILLATGSEVQLALACARFFESKNKVIRVVSIPCAERFLREDETYQEKILPKAIRKRVAIEALSTAYWYRFVGLDGVVIGLDTFGLSGQGSQLFDYFGITVEKLIDAVNVQLEQV